MSSVPFRLLPLVLSLNAGFVDTAGFLALQGLFTAHVTGNFVTLGASLVLGTSGALAKLLKNGTLKTYKGFPHGMPTTEARYH